MELRNHRIPIFLLSASIYTVKRGQAYAQDSIHEFFILKWRRGESYSEMTDVFPQTNISRSKERLFIQANWNLRGMGGFKP